MGETVELPLDVITLDVDLQPRVKIDKRLVEDYVYAIAEGAAMPPVTVVRVGEKHWLADGYHRFHAFQTLLAPTIPADVRDGDALDAVLISLRANAEHGKRRQAGDYRKAFAIARQFNLVSSTDSDEVATFLRCSSRTARYLVADWRKKERKERDEAIRAGKANGKSNREIAEELDLDEGTIRYSLQNGAEKRQSADFPHDNETGAPGDKPDHVSTADWNVMFSPTGQRWHQALKALRAINEQAEVSEMFDDRYTRIDHVFGPELERAHAWITELHRRYFDG